MARLSSGVPFLWLQSVLDDNPSFARGAATPPEQNGIALFALVGVSDAIAAPLAGRVADRRWSRPVTGVAILLVPAGLLVTLLPAPGSSLALLVLAAITIDFGVQTNLVLGYRDIFALAPEARDALMASTWRRCSWAARLAQRSEHGLMREAVGALRAVSDSLRRFSRLFDTRSASLPEASEPTALRRRRLTPGRSGCFHAFHVNVRCQRGRPSVRDGSRKPA